MNLVFTADLENKLWFATRFTRSKHQKRAIFVKKATIRWIFAIQRSNSDYLRFYLELDSFAIESFMYQSLNECIAEQAPVALNITLCQRPEKAMNALVSFSLTG